MISRLPTLVNAGRQFRARRLSPRELVTACLENIERLDEKFKAWVLVDAEGALRDADRLWDRLTHGEDLGPLHGIPVGVKDIVDVAAWPTRAGSPLRAAHRAERDAVIVQRLRAAGAILLGKTVTTEFACFDPSPTRNPWNPRHTPGGSSSGSAAAVSLEMCLAAVGSQTGGSIVRPASYCGIAGLKPTFGALSLRGIVPVSRHLDHPGPLAPCAADLAPVFQALRSGGTGNGIDPSTSGERPILRPVRAFFFERCDEQVRRATNEALRALDPGPPLAPPPGFDEVHRHHRRIMAVGAADTHADLFRRHGEQFGTHVAELIAEGLATSAVDYVAARRHQETFRRAVQNWLPPGHFAATPSTTTVAPARLDTTGDPLFNSPWSYAGVPTVTIPCGLAEGMPSGLQLIGPAGSEGPLLAAARWCEEQLGWSARPPD